MSAGNGVLKAAARGRLPDETLDVPAAPAKPRRIAILGKAPSSLGLAPFDDPSWEIWGLADLHKSIPRWDRWYEIHDLAKGKQRWPEEYWQWLCKDHGKPLYVQAPHRELPHGLPFPIAKLRNRFGDYFTNTVSYMIAHAVMEMAPKGKSVDGQGFEIGLWGVDMAQGASKPGDRNTEYGHQRPSCEYFLGVAAGLGIKITVPRESELLKTRRLYAFHGENNVFFEKIQLRRLELQQQLNECQATIEAHTKRSLILQGALDDLKWAEQWA